MKTITILALFFVIACGEQGKRCYSKEEAIVACQVEEMKKQQIDADTALIFCSPRYPYQGCYNL
jgi:hypothetical protein